MSTASQPVVPVYPASPPRQTVRVHRVKSFEVIATGSWNLRDKMATQCLGIVNIRTDDAEFVGHLIRNDEEEFIRVGTVVKTYRHRPEHPFDDRGRPEYQILKVRRDRCLEMSYRGQARKSVAPASEVLTKESAA